jgi:hypothetical protein
MPSIGKIHRILELLRENGGTVFPTRDRGGSRHSAFHLLSDLASLRQFDYVTQRRTDMRYFLGFVHLGSLRRWLRIPTRRGREEHLTSFTNSPGDGLLLQVQREMLRCP